AINETKHVREGEIFFVKDLFKGYEWNRIPKRDRLMLGSLFLSYIGTQDCKVTVADKGASGQQRYLKH
ncbi:MAG: single-stranded DNA-binding protein, partial [Sphaerochaeta associata]|uniref:single-stranded DNA-binding protein n=1 Tax=Sphaerochaeta associata TaxID=1129264 RepID=UPI002B1F67EA